MWFAVKLLFQSHVDDGRNEAPLCDEVIKLVDASSEDVASAKARAVATSDETRYTNHEGATVRWKFVDVAEVRDLCTETLNDGIEVYSRLFWKVDTPE